jgi:hypothetical protein
MDCEEWEGGGGNEEGGKEAERGEEEGQSGGRRKGEFVSLRLRIPPIFCDFTCYIHALPQLH